MIELSVMNYALISLGVASNWYVIDSIRKIIKNWMAQREYAKWEAEMMKEFPAEPVTATEPVAVVEEVKETKKTKSK